MDIKKKLVKGLAGTQTLTRSTTLLHRLVRGRYWSSSNVRSLLPSLLICSLTLSLRKCTTLFLFTSHRIESNPNSLWQLQSVSHQLYCRPYHVIPLTSVRCHRPTTTSPSLPLQCFTRLCPTPILRHITVPQTWGKTCIPLNISTFVSSLW